MKRYNCKFCGRYSAKRKICKGCKEKTPFVSSDEGQYPFNREKAYRKKK